MPNDKLKFYRVSDSYLNYLHSLEPKIHRNLPAPEKPNPQIGIILTINEHKYLAPLSSYKSHKYDRIKNWNKTIFKIWDESVTPNKPLSVIHLNNMYPILDTESEWMDFSLEEQSYQDLLNKEYSYIDKHKEDIRIRAKELYDEVLNGHPFYKGLSNDFLLLERTYTKFNNIPVSP